MRTCRLRHIRLGLRRLNLTFPPSHFLRFTFLLSFFQKICVYSCSSAVSLRRVTLLQFYQIFRRFHGRRTGFGNRIHNILGAGGRTGSKNTVHVRQGR
jgi:hypothetical protein